jgi:hypothetical protein
MFSARDYDLDLAAVDNGVGDMPPTLSSNGTTGGGATTNTIHISNNSATPANSNNSVTDAELARLYRHLGRRGAPTVADVNAALLAAPPMATGGGAASGAVDTPGDVAFKVRLAAHK